jgi:NADPH:quinone reductase-like Zn-dependent oxidoreductase
MKALGFTGHGDISRMTVFDLPQPKPGPGEILVEVKASAFNRLDIWVREGWPGLKLSLPHISGSDAAGLVAALGPGVETVLVGDRVAVDPGITLYEDEFTAQGQHSLSPGYKVLGEHLSGAHTEFIVVPAQNLLPLPEHISFEVAAAAGLVFMTAWRMLIHRAQIKASETVLILGAGGGVNSAAIQIAKFAGCIVYATTSTEEKMAQARSLGADVVLNYCTDPAWSKTIYRLTGKQGVDVVVDNVGAATLPDSLRAVKRGGRVVIVGNTSGPKTELDIRFLFGKQISLIGSTMGGHHDYRTVMNLIFTQKLTPVIHTVMPLTEGVEAMALLERGEQFGKVVLNR